MRKISFVFITSLSILFLSGCFKKPAVPNPQPIVPIPKPEPPEEQREDEKVFCTMDAKLCPDGETYVGRIPPTCEFAPCPGE